MKFKNKTLEQLENLVGAEPNFHSHVVDECHRLTKVPLKNFTIENLRIMLGQNIGTRYLLPIALEELEKEPLVEGDFYPGDLLGAVLRLPKDSFDEEMLLRLVSLVTSLVEVPKEIKVEYERFLQLHT